MSICLYCEIENSNFAKESDIKEKQGVVVKNIKKGSVSAKEIKSGDVITKIGRKNVTSIKDYQMLLNKYEKGDPILLLVKRNGSSRFVALEL